MPLTESENTIKDDKISNETNADAVIRWVCFGIFIFFTLRS